MANLDSLADALPNAEAESNPADSQVNVIKQKTLKHKPGALKRKERVEKLERERFAKNMAQLTTMRPPPAPTTATNENDANANANTNTNTQQNPTSDRWAALRSFISQTIDQQPAFTAKP